MTIPLDPGQRRLLRVWLIGMVALATGLLASLVLIFLAINELVPSSVGTFGFTTLLVLGAVLMVAYRFPPKSLVNSDRTQPITRRWVWIVVAVTWCLGLTQIACALVFLNWPWPGTLLVSGGIFIVAGAMTLWMTRSKATLTDR